MTNTTDRTAEITDRAAEIIYRTLKGKYGDFSHHGETAHALADAGVLATPELASTVEQQAERIASQESTLCKVEMIVERAMRKGYSPDAYELAEALGLDEEE